MPGFSSGGFLLVLLDSHQQTFPGIIYDKRCEIKPDGKTGGSGKGSAVSPSIPDDTHIRANVSAALMMLRATPARSSNVTLDNVRMWERSNSARQSEQGRQLEIRADRNWKGIVRDSLLLQKLFINVLPSISAAL